MSLKLTQTGGLLTVFLDGVAQTPQHRETKECDEHASKLLDLYPFAEVRYKGTIDVLCTNDDPTLSLQTGGVATFKGVLIAPDGQPSVDHVATGTIQIKSSGDGKAVLRLVQV